MLATQGLVPPDPGSYVLKTAMFEATLAKWATHPNGVRWLEWFAGHPECPEKDRKAIGAFLKARRKRP